MTVATALAVSWKAVDEFEPKGDHQSDAKQEVRQSTFDDRPGRFDVVMHTKSSEQQSAANNRKKNNHGLHIDRMIELWGRTSRFLRGGINR